MGLLHYSFKAPALTGQSVTATENTLPAVAGMVDIDFPVRFTERPTFTYGYEHGDNATAESGLMPMVASVVSWRTGRRAETGHPFYDGARILISAPQVATAGGSSVPLWARLEWVPVGGQPADTVIRAGNGNTWNVLTDEIGLTINANGVIGTPAGLVVATSVVDFSHATAGSRWSELAGPVTFSRDEKMAVTVAGRGTFNNMTVVERVAALPNNFALSFAHYGTGATLGIVAYLTIALWP